MSAATSRTTVTDYNRSKSSLSLFFNPSALFIPSVLVKNA